MNKKANKRKLKQKIRRSLKGALVKGYLEKKDKEGFKLLFPKYKQLLGDSSGIYALYKGKKLYYVGIAQNLLNRVNSHVRYRHGWDKVSFFIIDKQKYSKDIETLILRIVGSKPKGNKTRGKFEKHYDLQDKLNKIRREMKDLLKKV